LSLRLTYRARIGLIVFLCLAATWIASLSVFYEAQREQGAIRPLPSQIVALVRLLESAPVSERPLILASVASETLTVRLEPGGDGADGPGAFLARQALELALSEIGGRPFVVVSEARHVGLVSPIAPTVMEIRVRLLGGESLVVRTRSTLLVSLLGLPVGFASGLFGTAAALVALVLMQREAGPLVRLAAAVDGIDLACAPVGLSVPRHCAPEIHALAGAFDRLQSRLSDMLAARTAMVAGISHDVRTFATRLRLRADGIGDDAERARAVADIADMICLLDDALLASRADAGELMQELVDLAEVVGAEAAACAAQGHPAVVVSAPGADQALVLGERLGLRRIVANLIDNAVKYGRAARLSLAAEGDAVWLSVEDDGPGVPRSARAAIMEPFVRLEGSRSRATGGAGLGLAIARHLAEAHGGSVTVGDAPGAGARFVLRLPRYRIAG